MEIDTLKGYTESGLTIDEIGRRTGRSYTTIRYWLKKYGLQTARVYRKFSWEREELIPMLQDSRSISEFLRKAGLTARAGNFNSLYRYAKSYNISIEGLLRKDKIQPAPKHKPEDLFTKNSLVVRSTVRRQIIKLGLIPYICNECGQEPVWRGKPMSLILDHKDGDSVNHELSNLRFLCPNCNSTLETHCKGFKGLK